MTDDKQLFSATERQLIEIWQTALELPSLQADVDFIDLGGDSLSAMICISRVRSLFNCELSIVDFYMDGATIRNFATAIDDWCARTDKPASSSISIKAAD